jgi:8-oxo-dGTP diphosphatase
MSKSSFAGAKIALLCGSNLITIQRDDIEGLWAAGKWDFLGGGRENAETPFECLTREAREELNIDLNSPEIKIVWSREYPALHDESKRGYFFVGLIKPAMLKNAQLGDEGQQWRWMPIQTYLRSPKAIPGLQERLQDYLLEQNGTP